LVILQDNGFEELRKNMWVKYEIRNGLKIPKYFATSKIHNNQDFFVLVKNDKGDIVLNTNNANEIRSFILQDKRDEKISKLID
jgi:Zn-dependent peptidase ImmA (M78 family)